MAADGFEPALILHRRPYRETSLLLEVFTRDSGRLGIVARGAKRRNAALLQPFVPLLLRWGGRGELRTLKQAEPRGRLDLPQGRSLISAFYLNELLLRLIHRDDPHPELFQRYEQTLVSLSEPAEIEWTLRLFERDLLDALGYGLSLESDVSGASVRAGQCYCYDLEIGPRPFDGAPCPPGGRVSGETLQALASGGKPGRSELQEAKGLMRRTLALYLGERPLRSRELMRDFAKTDNRGEGG